VFDNGKLISYGLLDFSKYKGIDKLYQVKMEIVNLIDKYNPDLVILEDNQFQNNYKVYALLNKLLGILECALYELNVKYEVVASSTWRKTIGINCRAKREVLKAKALDFVKDKFNIEPSQEDCADSICIGYFGTLIHS
jgi:Holliday junction resolvasome RuvABC endonuclease subunit